MWKNFQKITKGRVICYKNGVRAGAEIFNPLLSWTENFDPSPPSPFTCLIQWF